MAGIYNTNLLNVATAYIKQLNVSVTEASMRQRLNENPYFPSLYSLSNTFDRFNIPHQAFKIDNENFHNLIPPYITYVKGQNTGKDFVLVISVTNDEVRYIADGKTPKKVTKKDFLKNWEHVVLQASADEQSGERDFIINRKKEITNTNRLTLLIATCILIFGTTLFFFLHSISVQFIFSASALLIIKIMGLAATILLLVYEIDKSNAFLKSICTVGKQTNCGAILKSRASKIFGMRWSEAGFFYFASTFLFLLFPSTPFTTKIFILTVANCLALPYILFSVYYQWKVVKQWCTLCLTVQAVLAMELTWSIINFWPHPLLPITLLYSALLPITYCLLLPIALWYIVKSLILKAKNEPLYKAAYKRLLYNPDTFSSLLQQQPTAPDGYQNIGISLGNPNAKNTIIKICNPYCGSCAEAHPLLSEIVHSNKNVKLKLIFTATNDEKDIRGIVVKHLLAINEKKDDLLTQQALDNWYLADGKNYEVFSAKYPMNGELKNQEAQVEAMKTWCKEAGILIHLHYLLMVKLCPLFIALMN